jgi:hypothetical protein
LLLSFAEGIDKLQQQFFERANQGGRVEAEHCVYNSKDCKGKDDAERRIAALAKHALTSSIARLPRDRPNDDIGRLRDRNISGSSQMEGIVMASQKAQAASSSRTGEVSINLDKLNTALQGAIAESLHQLAQETRGTAKIAVVKTVAPAEAEGIQIYEDDPFLQAVAGSSPIAADPIRIDEPSDTQALLQTQIIGQQPDPEVYQPGAFALRRYA